MVCPSVRVFVHGLKGKQLELSMPKLVVAMAGSRHALTLISEGQVKVRVRVVGIHVSMTVRCAFLVLLRPVLSTLSKSLISCEILDY